MRKRLPTIEEQAQDMATWFDTDYIDELNAAALDRTATHAGRPYAEHGCARCKHEWRKRLVTERALEIKGEGMSQQARVLTAEELNDYLQDSARRRRDMWVVSACSIGMAIISVVLSVMVIAGKR